MLTYEEMQHHPTSERIVEILCEKTQSKNHRFFRILVGFQFSMMAAHMRCHIKTHERGEIPVNMYALNLMPSGAGKGFSTKVMEDQITYGFRHRFMETFDTAAEKHLDDLAFKRHIRKGSELPDEQEAVRKEFKSLGPLLYDFDSGTGPAVKQMRHKLLMANAGAVNLVVDEIGLNLPAMTEIMPTFLELFDVGSVKQKLVKNTNDNLRGEEIIGRTPTNLMAFGTPGKLLDGGKTEDQLMELLETGYARRCFFGMAGEGKKVDMTPEEVYDLMTKNSTSTFIEDLCDDLERLADASNMRRVLTMDKDTALLSIEYKLKCEKIAAGLPEHQEAKKAEVTHRYFKALKLAGAYAFVDDSPVLTMDHLYAAIKVAEESGECFDMLMTRDRPYVKLAKYLAATNSETTVAELDEDLPFYRGSRQQKDDMLVMATAWGYKNNIIIKKTYEQDIMFLRGEALQATDIHDKSMIVAYSQDIAYGYFNDLATWDDLWKMTQANGIHWINHHLNGGEDRKGHRNEENCRVGFNLLVIDIDHGCKLSTAKEFLKGYKALLYTTKRHQTDGNGDRFRIILPLNYTLKMDAKEYKEFYNAVIEFLPFEVDDGVGQRARKWLSHGGHYEYLDGELFDALPFIPKTTKDEERRRNLKDQASMDKLERWVINNTGDGNRNNMLLRYAMILLDAGFSVNAIHGKVNELNSKMADKLSEIEIASTIMVSVAKKAGANGN